jgi:AcrR family transcriptional regulator
MARDPAATRRRILESALRLLRTRGIDAFSVEAVAGGAAVAKGLVIYHYGSRAHLLRQCGAALQAERRDRLRWARESAPGIQGIDACWEELRRQTADGTTRAWLGLVAVGAVPAPAEPDPDAVVVAGVLDGCAVALAVGVAEAAVREAHDALWLAVLRVIAEPA